MVFTMVIKEKHILCSKPSIFVDFDAIDILCLVYSNLCMNKN